MVETPPLWKHQADALARFEELPGFGLFADMGTGKTRVPIEWHNRHRPARTLVATVTSAVWVWEGEFAKYGAGHQKVVLLNGPIKERVALVKEHVNCPGVVFVTNWEGTVYEPFRSLLQRIPWDLVVADEAHKLKKPSGRTSRLFGSLKAEKRIALTGTPLADKPVDAWALYRFIDKRVFQPTFAKFKLEYVNEIRVPFPKVVGYRNLDDYAARIWSVASRVKAGDVLDLPPVLPPQWRAAPLDERSRRAYESMNKELVAEIPPEGEAIAANVLARLRKLHQIANGFVLDPTGKVISVAPTRMEVLRDILEPLDEPVVVFANYREDFARIKAITSQLGRRYGEISGKSKDVGPGGTFPENVDVLAVHPKSGGSGLNLTRARVAVYYSIDFPLQDFEQSKARIHRPGQTRATQYVFIFAPNTIDETIIRALEDKRDTIQAALGRK